MSETGFWSVYDLANTAVCDWLLVLLATPARADAMLVPHLGQAFSGVLNDAGGGLPTTYGVRVEWFMKGIVGLGVDLARTPDFLADAQGRVRESSLSALMGNVIIGGPLPAELGFRPYLSGGVGLLSYDLTRTTGAAGLGCRLWLQHWPGASARFSRHVGAELDFPYFRHTQEFTLGGLDFPEEILEHARWSGGLVLRF